MKKKIWIPIIVGIVAVGVFLGDIWVTHQGKGKQYFYKIGAVLPLSGSLAMIGEPERNAIILAQERINLEGGINGKKLEVLIEDSKGAAKEAVTIASKFVEIDGVKILIVSTSPSILATAPIVQKKNSVMFAITSTPRISDGKNIFRISPDSGQEMELFYELLKAKNIREVVFVYPNNEFGSLTKEIFSKLYTNYGNIVFSEAYQIGGKDFRTTILKFKQFDPEWIIFFGYPGDIPTFIKQARELGVKSKFITSMATTWPQTVKALSEMNESPLFLAPLVNVEKLRPKESSDFAKIYEERFASSPNWDAFYVYDTVMLIADAIRRVGKTDDIEQFRRALNNITTFKGVAGMIELLPIGDIKTTLVLSTISYGKIVPAQ